MTAPTPDGKAARASGLAVTVREPVVNDAAELGRICFEAFREIALAHGFPPDFPSVDAAREAMVACIRSPAAHGVVAEVDGRLAGSGFIHDRRPVAGIGPITVDPVAQDRGVGRRLMETMLGWARGQGFSAVRLVQVAYHSRSLALYAGLGFEAREPLTCLQGPPIARSISGRSVRPATPADGEACQGLCRAVHGFARDWELAGATERGSARVVERTGRLVGYATELGYGGHAVAEENEDLLALIGGADAFLGPGILVPTRNGELLRWCLTNGLRVVQPLTLMALGWYEDPRGPFLPSILF